MSPLPTLPDFAQSILNRELAKDDDSRARRTAKIKQRQALRSQRDDALARRVRLETADQQRRLTKEVRTDEGEKTVVRNTAPLKAVNAEIDGYDRRIAELDASEWPRRMTGARMLTGLKPGVEYVEVDRPALSLRKGERKDETLLRVRADNDAATAELKATRQRPCSLADAKSAARQEIAASVRLPQIAGLFHGNGIRWPVNKIYVKTDQQPTVIDGAGLLAWAFQDQLVKKIDTLLDLNASAFPDAISESDRAAQVEELEVRIADGERIESALVEAIIAEGGEAYHRPHIDVLTVLGIAVA